MKKQVVSFSGTVAEMTGIKGGDINVPFAPGVDVDKLIEGDENPMFVTVEAMNEGVSANKRNYTRDLIMDVAKQVNDKKPDAYEGHITDAERQTKRPKPQTIWLGSVVKEIEGKTRLFVKGYVLPYAKELREYLQKAKASAKHVTVSIYGQALQAWDEKLKAYDVRNFVLESIDWTRDNSAGMMPGVAFRITGEMREDFANREEIISELSLDEVKQFNPNLIKAVAEASRASTLSEMADIADDTLSTIKEMVGTDPIESINEMQAQLREFHKREVNEVIENTLREEVANPRLRPAIRRIVVSEMGNSYTLDNAKEVLNSVLQSSEVVSIIRETTSSEINPTKDNRVKKDGRKFTTL
jgi:hypothetical protein